jgi:tRNA threonylcarbamoyladenosine biosynthesis protein TsaE
MKTSYNTAKANHSKANDSILASSAITIESHDKMVELGAKLARASIKAEKLFLYLQGDLGAGKTTLARGFIRALGYGGLVKSPTYPIVEPYEIGIASTFKKLYHFDLYRLNQPNELTYIGADDYFAQNAFFLVEWPEKYLPVLPTADLLFQLTIVKDIRNVNMIAYTQLGQKILSTLE